MHRRRNRLVFVCPGIWTEGFDFRCSEAGVKLGIKRIRCGKLGATMMAWSRFYVLY